MNNLEMFSMEHNHISHFSSPYPKNTVTAVSDHPSYESNEIDGSYVSRQDTENTNVDDVTMVQSADRKMRWLYVGGNPIKSKNIHYMLI